MEKIRILHIINNLHIAGAETQLFRLIKHLPSEEFEHEVVNLKGVRLMEERIQSLGVKVHNFQLREKKINWLFVLPRLRSIVQRFQPDIIQGWLYHGNTAASLTKRLFYKRTDVYWNIRHSLHDLDNESFVTKSMMQMNKLLSKSADRIIFNSKVSLQQHKEYGLDTSKALFVPNAFDMSKFKSDKSICDGFRKQNGISDQSIILGMSCRYHPVKGHSLLFEALSRIQKDFAGFTLVLVGHDTDKNNAQLVEDLKRYQLLNRSCLLGFRKDPENIYPAFDLAVLPSLGEGLPNFVGEAMSCETPCISTRVGEVEWLIGDTGFVAEPGNVDSLEKELRKAFKLSEIERKAMGQKARKRIESDMNIPTIVDRYADLYRETNERYASQSRYLNRSADDHSKASRPLS